MSTAAAYRDQWAATVTEAAFQAQVIALAKTLGWSVYHTHDSRRSEPGFPDLVLVHPQRGVRFRELKKHNGRITRDQNRWLADLLHAGADADTWRPGDLISGRIERELKRAA